MRDFFFRTAILAALVSIGIACDASSPRLGYVNVGPVTSVATAATATVALDLTLSGQTTGDHAYFNGSNWVRVAGSSIHKTVVFTSASTVWVAPADVSRVWAYGYGGGSGGAYGGNGFNTTGGGGGGGVGGTPAFPVGLWVTVVPGTSYTNLVGAGGDGGVRSGPTNATAGGDTKITFTSGGALVRAWAGASFPTAGVSSLTSAGGASTFPGGLSNLYNQFGVVTAGATISTGSAGTGGQGGSGATHTAGTTLTTPFFSVPWTYTVVPNYVGFTAPVGGTSGGSNGGGGGAGGTGGCPTTMLDAVTSILGTGGNGGNGTNTTTAGNGSIGGSWTGTGNTGCAGGGGGGGGGCTATCTAGTGGNGGAGDNGKLTFDYDSVL